MAKMTTVLLRLEPELLDAIDRARGDVPRALFVRKRLAEAVAAPAQVATPARKLPNGGGYMAPSGGPPTKPPTGGSSVQFGPTPRAPGVGLKPDKVKR